MSSHNVHAPCWANLAQTHTRYEAELVRLRAHIESVHQLDETYRDGYHEEWHCTCGEFIAVGPEAPTARGGHKTRDEAEVLLKAHVKGILYP